LADYKDGNDKGFRDGDSYYYAQRIGLSNQLDVDDYRLYNFFSVEDYEDAKRLGIFNENNAIKEWYMSLYDNYSRYNYGTSPYPYLISFDDIKNNLRYINMFFYTVSIRVDGGREYGRDNNLLNNDDINYILRGYGDIGIQKLNNYNYFLLRIGNLNNDISNKKDVIYYFYKFISEFNFQNITETVLNNLEYNTIDELIHADQNGILNSTDYRLVNIYGITIQQLTENRSFINELENIKQNYLSSYNITDQYGESSPTLENRYAFTIYYMLRQSRGIPMSERALNDYIANERNNNSIINNFTSYNSYIVNLENLFNSIPTLSRIFQYGNGSFYLK
jgi:hypothetical protein